MQPGTVKEEKLWQTDPFLRYYEEFIELAAHDLYAPLRKLNVFTERLTKKYSAEGPGEADEYVRRINSSLAELVALVEGLREYSLLIPHDMKYGNCDANSLVEKAVIEHSELIHQNQVRIEYDELPVIFGDEEQLGLLFKKLLGNCVKFRKKDQPLLVKVTVEETTKQQETGEVTYYCFRISDNGTGIDEKRKEKIFLPLQRSYGRSEDKGNGLGLACVRRIAENHKGVIFLEEGCSEGCSMIFLIPKKQL